MKYIFLLPWQLFIVLKDKHLEAYYQLCQGNNAFVSLTTGYGMSIKFLFDDAFLS